MTGSGAFSLLLRFYLCFEDAKRNILSWLDETLPEEEMDRLLGETRADALREVPYSFKGHPWGALDARLKEALGEKPLSPHLCFGELEEEQELWRRFLENGYLDEPDPADPPASFMVQDEWFRMLERSVESADRFNWNAWYHLGVCYYARDDYKQAREAFERSLSLRQSTWANHGMACVCFSTDRAHEGAAYMAKALALNPGNLPLAKEALRLSCLYEEYRPALSMYAMLSEEHRKDPLILGFRAIALAHTGREEEAKAILDRDGLVMTDLREGDDSVVSAYIYVVQALAAREGRQVDPDDVKVPAAIDFRMFHSDRED